MKVPYDFPPSAPHSQALRFSTMIDFDAPDFRKVSNGLDPVGLVFQRDDGKYYRAVRAESRPWLNMIQDTGVLELLASKSLIPSQSVLVLRDNVEYCATLISEGNRWNIHPSAYPLDAFHDAALLWIEINEILASMKRGWGLIDAHYSNFAIFERSRPKWVDIGSIGPLEHPQQGLKQFLMYFIYPLLIFSRKPELSWQLRSRIRNPQGGMPDTEAAEYLGGAPDVRLPSGMLREEALRMLRQLVESISFEGSRGFWSDYREEQVLPRVLDGSFLQTHTQTDPRPSVIADLVRAMDTSSVIDAGANDGLFSILAAKGADAVLALDMDDLALNKLYRFVSHHPAVNVCVSAQEFLSVRNQADLVLALALSHHLVLRQKLSFDQVAEKLAEMSRKAVLTEYMPDGLGGTRTHPDVAPKPLPAEYTLDICLAALRKYFSNVMVIDYGRRVKYSRRTLILCIK